MRIGAKLPNSGGLAMELGVPTMARTLEEAGFESLWVSDHIVMPAQIASSYPFAADGRATWPTDTPYLDALVALALAAAATSRAQLGTALLVLPLRHPVELAKQAASIDVASGGRLQLGVGAGWLAEEFEALGVPFATRGRRLEDWMALARSCWSGTPPRFESDSYSLPADVICLPTPVQEIPLLVGGHSPVALRRAGRIGDGWLGQQSLNEMDPGALRVEVEAIAEAARRAGRDPRSLRHVLRIVDSAGRPEEVARHLPDLAGAGIEEVIVDVDWSAGEIAGQLGAMRDAAVAG